MFMLAESELNLALAAINKHGYGDFFPEPAELDVLRANWQSICAELATIDLDTYEGYAVVTAFAPKSRLNLRRVSLLHPFDLVFYTALVLALRDDIGSSRLPSDEHRVFSYRAEGAAAGFLYNDVPNYRHFKDAVAERVQNAPESHVGVTDIADFYPRIYQHRLVNALQAATGAAKQRYIRVLEKMLARFSENVSYGIPIGPPASRPLGEAVLIDVDSTLISFGVDFLRFTDDYVIFADMPEDAEYGIRVLAETLYLNHGLTLQTAKTKVLKGSEYVEQYLVAHDDKEEGRRKLIAIVGDYDESLSYEQLTEEARKEIDALNLSGMLTDALAEGKSVDFKEVSFILGRLSALEKPDLIPIVLDNLDRLSPVAHSVASFFTRFSQLDPDMRETVATDLLDPLLRQSKYASEYYAIWVLSIFASNAAWNHAENLLRIFRDTHSDAIRRFAALALRVSGTRAQVVNVRPYLQASSSLCRTAIILATAKMGQDERRYLRQSLRLHDSFERLCIGS
jgi:hypothetical protein